ncbi:MAG: DASS family sodium-coupled anion symporter [Halanaeroarchaeum sp.]
MARLNTSVHHVRVAVFAAALLGTLAIALAPTPAGLSPQGQYALATMFFAAVLWVTRAIPLPVTALSIPIVLVVFGVYDSIDPALTGFADPLIFLFIAGFMLANALQKYHIDRRIALRIMETLGFTPRLLILAVMVATAFLSMWVSNTATAAMMLPIALGILSEVVDDAVVEEGSPSNMQVATLLGVAYAASVGGVGTLIGTPPNAVVVAFLDRLVGYQLTFADWLVVGIPVVVLTLPLLWYILAFHLYPPEVEDIHNARERAAEILEDEGDLGPYGRRVAIIFALTAGLWMLGGLGFLFRGVFSDPVFVTLFGGAGENVFGGTGHQGVLYFVVVGLLAIPALVLAGAADWDDLADIDWGTIILFGGGISLADALANTGGTGWLANAIFGALVAAPAALVVFVVIVFAITMTEMTSNTATTSIIAPVLIGIGGLLSGTLGLAPRPAAVFLAVVGGLAASFAFALPVATPPNALVFGSGHVEQRQMLRAGILLNVVMSIVLTVLVVVLYLTLWPLVLW